jgi:hypothetical protein
MMSRSLGAFVVLLVTVALADSVDSGRLSAQGRRGAPAPPPAPRVAAPIDLTGYWVSVVTQDWRQRMVTPPKGDYASVPITVEAKRVADAWDPAKDDAAGEQCKSYGAPAVMAVPGRLRISWQDDATLKVEMDAGTQTRLFHFGASKPRDGARSWQGYSVAAWQTPPARAAAAAAKPATGSLKVVTTQLRAGYLRKNGIPYSANAVVTEHWDLVTQRDGKPWIVVTTMVEDPQYLEIPWITALHFAKEPDGAKWAPTPCSTTW